MAVLSKILFRKETPDSTHTYSICQWCGRGRRLGGPRRCQFLPTCAC